MNKLVNVVFVFYILGILCHAEIQIVVDANSGRMPISPLIYGKNGCGVSDDPAKPSTDADLLRSREAGLRFARENMGNNLTKYNWRKA